MKKGFLPLEQGGSTQPSHSSARKRVPFLCVLILVITCTTLGVLTFQSVTELRSLEKRMAVLETRVSDGSTLCRTEVDGFNDNDDDDNEDFDHVDTPSYPVYLELPKNVPGSDELSFHHHDHGTSETSALSQDESTEGTRVPPGHTKEGSNRNTTIRGREGEGKISSAEYRLNLPDADNYYHTIKGYTLFPWKGESSHGTRNKHPFYHTKQDGKTISINKHGLYLIYTQISFHNSAPHNIGAIVVNGENIAQCTQSSSRIDTNVGMFANCFTAAVRYLPKDSNVEIRSLFRNRQILSRPRNTFVGLVKLN